MPELPEVETMRRGILGIQGARIQAVIRPPCIRRPSTILPSWAKFQRDQQNRRIDSVERLGKRIVLVLDNKLRVVIEPRMTGLVLLSDPPTQEHLRVEWQLSHSKKSGGKSKQLWFWDRRGLGVVRLVDDRDFERFYGADKIGPDALAVKCEQFVEQLCRGRRAIKVALLDQRAVAGIGNLYASEILHRAGVHPAARCERLKPDQWDRIFHETQIILNEAITYEGSTLGDGTYRNVLNQNGSYQNHHRVYDREDEPCKTCKQAKIIRIVQAQRSTFFCPDCQKRSLSQNLK